MRRIGVLLACTVIGCFSQGNYCEKAPCPPATSEPCEGPCAPYVGGVWSAVLVASAAAAPPCPVEVAPFETMSSAAPPVTACAVQEDDGACSRGFVCLPPVPPPWAVCVLRDGPHSCPAPYPSPVEVDSGVTVCCLAPAGEPE